jgi:hypothetical protein
MPSNRDCRYVCLIFRIPYGEGDCVCVRPIGRNYQDSQASLQQCLRGTHKDGMNKRYSVQAEIIILGSTQILPPCNPTGLHSPFTVHYAPLKSDLLSEQ